MTPAFYALYTVLLLAPLGLIPMFRYPDRAVARLVAPEPSFFSVPVTTFDHRGLT